MTGTCRPPWQEAVGHEIIPDTHKNGCANEATTGLTLGLSVMLLLEGVWIRTFGSSRGKTQTAPAIAVGTPITGRPRTEPYVPLSCIRSHLGCLVRDPADCGLPRNLLLRFLGLSSRPTSIAARRSGDRRW
jgi:hypothetical protein